MPIPITVPYGSQSGNKSPMLGYRHYIKILARVRIGT
jgi:hypothetical protein